MSVPGQHSRRFADVGERLLADFTFVERLVGPAFGPAGRSVLHARGQGSPRILRRGVAIVEAANGTRGFGVGATILAEAMSTLDRDLGNGATTAALLARALGEAMLPVVAAGMPIEDAIGSMREFTAASARNLRNRARTATAAHIAAFIENSSSGDEVTSANIRAAREKLNGFGEIVVDQSPAPRNALEIASGFHIEGGFAHARLVRRKGAPEEISAPLLLILRGELSDLSPVARRLNQLVESGRNLVIVADSVSGDALSALVANKDNPHAVVTAIAGPGKGSWRMPLLEDLAVFSGGNVISSDTGTGLESLSPADLGKVARMVISDKFAIAFDGAGSPDTIDARKTHIRREIEAQRYLAFDRTEHKKRLARFGSGIVWLHIEKSLDFEERRAAAESTVQGIRLIEEGGVLPTGAASLLHAATQNPAGHAHLDMRLFARLKTALEAPVSRLLATTFGDRIHLAAALKADGDAGFDATRGCLSEDAASFPATAIARAVDVAASVTSTAFTAGAYLDPGNTRKQRLL